MKRLIKFLTKNPLKKLKLLKAVYTIIKNNSEKDAAIALINDNIPYKYRPVLKEGIEAFRAVHKSIDDEVITSGEIEAISREITEFVIVIIAAIKGKHVEINLKKKNGIKGNKKGV